MLGDRFEGGWNGNETLGLRLHEHLFADRLVGGRNGNLALGFRRYQHLFRNRFHRCRNRNEALGLRLYQHLLGDGSRRGWNHFKALGRGHLDDLLGLGIKARANHDVGEAIAAACQERDWARKVVAEIVVTLLHCHADELSSRVGVEVDWHVWAERHILSDQRRAHAVAAL